MSKNPSENQVSDPPGKWDMMIGHELKKIIDCIEWEGLVLSFSRKKLGVVVWWKIPTDKGNRSEEFDYQNIKFNQSYWRIPWSRV